MEEARNILRCHEKRTNGDLTEWQERWILEAMEEYAMQFKNGMIEWMKKCNLLQNELLLIERKNAFGEKFNSTAKCEQALVMGSCQHQFAILTTFTVPDPTVRCIKCGFETNVGNLP